MENLESEIKLKLQLFKEVKLKINNLSELNNLKNEFLKNYLKLLYSNLKVIDDDQKKKSLGKIINDYKKYVELEIKELETSFKEQKDVSSYDITIRKDNIKFGSIHPLIKFYKKIEDILIRLGFSVVQGPEVELDKYNFEMLNIPHYHPARDMQDTFYVAAPNILLRSHTSSVQIRTMKENSPPIQVISPGTVYRVDDIDPQHTPMFYQVEGLMIGEEISFANLKAVLVTVLKEIFGESTKVRFRPSYYPYTEPSAAIDMSCTECGSKGCKTCGGSGWITVLGSGMVHPNVLEGVGYDSNKYIGFAFGLGLNRLALLYYGIGEIRKFYENNVSLWRQI